MEPIDFLGALRRSWRLLAALAVIGALVAVLIPVSAHHKKHVSKNPLPWTASAVVGAAPTGINSLVGGGATGGQIQFYASETNVQAAALKAAHLKRVHISHVGLYLKSVVIVPKGEGKRQAQNANTVQLTGSGTSAAEAVRLTNAYAKEVGIYLNKIAATRSTASHTISGSGYVIVRPAVKAFKQRVAKVGAGPVASHKVRALIGLAAGVLLGAVLVLLREVLNRRLRSAARTEVHFGYPVVVEIPAELRAIGRPALKVDVVSDPRSPAAEAYRMLRMSVMFEGLASGVLPSEDLTNLVGVGNLIGAPPAVGPAGPGNGSDPSGPAVPGSPGLAVPGSREVVLVASASNESTRPQVAANLAATYAEAGERVVVIGTGDLGAGPLNRAGGSLNGDISPEDVEARLEPSWVERVFRLNLRHFIDNSGQLVARMPAVLAATRPLADVIIIEAPALLAVHHAEALSHAVDVVVVVAECGKTTFDDAHRSGDLLRRMGAPVLGVVLTNVRLKPGDVRQLPVRDLPELSSPTVLAEDPDATDTDVGTGSPAVPTQV
jgi:Mrp family chromosome partitioning ATPase